MKSNSTDDASKRHFAFRFTYILTLFMLYISGFGQLPIFKRYYIADIPGLGWLAQFYVTHYLHYLFALLFMAMVAYVITMHVMEDRKFKTITKSGYFRIVVLGGLVLTGLLLVIRNFTGTWFSPNVIIALDLTHIALVMVMLFTGLFGLIFRWQWAENK